MEENGNKNAENIEVDIGLVYWYGHVWGNIGCVFSYTLTAIYHFTAVMYVMYK
jgi:hypothetical protein